MIKRSDRSTLLFTHSRGSNVRSVASGVLGSATSWHAPDTRRGSTLVFRLGVEVEGDRMVMGPPC